MSGITQIFTIGYEKAELADFIATLQHSAVSTLVDIRELPISRRRGFAKNSLAQALLLAGINYRHERQLGTPKTIRDQHRNDHDHNGFFAAYHQHLQTHSHRLDDLMNSLQGNIALMCLEKDPNTCHRLMVGAALGELLKITPIHLYVQPTIVEHGHTSLNLSSESID